MKNFLGQQKKKDSQPEQETQPIEKMPSKQCNEKILKLKQELNATGALLDDLVTVPSSAKLETITEKYWKNFE